MTLRRDSQGTKEHTASSLADVLEKHYFPMLGGAQLYLSEHEWRLVLSALKNADAVPQGLETGSPKHSRDMPPAESAPSAVPFGWWDHFNGVLHRTLAVANKAEDGGNKITPLYAPSAVPCVVVACKTCGFDRTPEVIKWCGLSNCPHRSPSER